MSEPERHQMIGKLIAEKSVASQRRAEIDTKLKALGERLERLGRGLQNPERSVSEDSLRELLAFGPDSGVTVDGLVGILNERQRLSITIRDCEQRLGDLGV